MQPLGQYLLSEYMLSKIDTVGLERELEHSRIGSQKYKIATLDHFYNQPSSWKSFLKINKSLLKNKSSGIF